MEKDESKSKLPSTSDGTKTQEAADGLAEEEASLRKEVELFLQEELDKLLAENETSEEGAEQLPRKTSQESKASEKPRGPPKKTKVGVEQASGLEKTGVQEDLLTLLDEPWDLLKEPTGGELENQWDNLSMLDESTLELKPKEMEVGPSRQDEAAKISAEEEEEEEEEEKKREGQEKEEHLVKMSAKGGQHLLQPVFLDYLEEEDNLKDGSKHSLWSMRSNIGAIFEHKIQHLQNLKDTIQKKSITTLPHGYFSKLSKCFTRSGAAEKEEQTSEDAEPRDQPQDWMPRFMKKSKTKRMVGFRTKSLKKSQLERDQVTELSKIFSEDFFRSQDRRGSEDVLDEDLPLSPEDFPQQNEEELKQTQETKKQEDESISSSPDVPSSSWHMGQGISPRQMGHSREFPESVFKEKAYKQKFAKHERDSKVSVPLPLQELMEEEILAILKATLLDYQKKLGAHHPLTGQMEQQVDKLHLLLQGRGII